ncbi:MAG TPA: hypothetical protein VIJ15_06430 [Dermatophilaceae bacterium]
MDATEAGVVEAVKESFTHALIVDRQLGNPLSQGSFGCVRHRATDLQAARRTLDVACRADLDGAPGGLLPP